MLINNNRNIKDLHTAEGIKEKIKAVSSFIKRSYRDILSFSNQIKEITNHHISYGREIWLLADEDEIFGIVSSVLDEMGIAYSVAKSTLYHLNSVSKF